MQCCLIILPWLFNNRFSNRMKLFSRLNFTMVNSYNAHTILGINRQASQKQIKTAYYKLAKQYHPDNNPKDKSTDMFHKITKAYEILIEDARNHGSKSQRSNRYNDFNKNQGKSWSDDDEMFKAYQTFKKKKNVRSDSFHKFMEFYEEYISGAKKDQKKKHKSQQNHRKHQHAQDQQREEQEEQQSFSQSNQKQRQYFKTKKLQIFIDLSLSEQQAKTGVDRRLKYNKKIICIQCKGKPHKRQTICKKCNGSGIKMMKHSIGVCYQCGGNKTVQYGDCHGCHGQGFFVKHAQQFVHIRSGVAHNDEIFVNGKGHQNQKNGHFGDLVIKIKIHNQRQQMDSSGIKKVGFNTYHTVKVSVFDAILGADIKYKTLWGDKNLFLKSGTQDGAVIKRMGQGSRRNNRLSGDHFITINIEIPKEFTAEQEKIYKRIREIYRSKFPDL